LGVYRDDLARPHVYSGNRYMGRTAMLLGFDGVVTRFRDDPFEMVFPDGRRKPTTGFEITDGQGALRKVAADLPAPPRRRLYVGDAVSMSGGLDAEGTILLSVGGISKRAPNGEWVGVPDAKLDTPLLTDRGLRTKQDGFVTGEVLRMHERGFHLRTSINVNQPQEIIVLTTAEAGGKDRSPDVAPGEVVEVYGWAPVPTVLCAELLYKSAPDNAWLPVPFEGDFPLNWADSDPLLATSPPTAPSSVEGG
jgi:hypothetical protein